MGAAYRRRSDGVVVSPSIAEQYERQRREELFEELDAAGRVVPTAFEQQLLARHAADVAAATRRREEEEARDRAMASDAVRRPHARQMTRDQLLVDIGRALHAAFPARADDLITEIEARLPPDDTPVYAAGAGAEGMISWDPGRRVWLFTPV